MYKDSMTGVLHIEIFAICTNKDKEWLNIGNGKVHIKDTLKPFNDFRNKQQKCTK